MNWYSPVFSKRTIISIAGRSQFLVRAPIRNPIEGSRIVAPLKKNSNDKSSSPSTSKPLAYKKSINQVGPLNEASLKGEDAPLDPEDDTNRRRGRNQNNPLTWLGTETNSPTSKDLIVRLLKTRLIKNMTKNGKYQRFSILLAVGNGRGGVGVALAKSVSAIDAINKATKQAIRNMEWFPLWQNRTLHHDDQLKYKATLLFTRPAAPQTGRLAHPTIVEICRCMGLADISAKVLGSRNPLNVAEAFLRVLRRQKTPEEVAQDGGIKIVDVLKVYQQGCEELTKTLRAERYSTLNMKLTLKEKLGQR